MSTLMPTVKLLKCLFFYMIVGWLHVNVDFNVQHINEMTSEKKKLLYYLIWFY